MEGSTPKARVQQRLSLFPLLKPRCKKATAGFVHLPGVASICASQWFGHLGFSMFQCGAESYRWKDLCSKVDIEELLPSNEKFWEKALIRSKARHRDIIFRCCLCRSGGSNRYPCNRCPWGAVAERCGKKVSLLLQDMPLELPGTMPSNRQLICSHCSLVMALSLHVAHSPGVLRMLANPFPIKGSGTDSDLWKCCGSLGQASFQCHCQ